MLDASALGLTTGFGVFLQYLEGRGGLQGAGTFDRAVTGANVLLAYAKLAVMVAAFHADFRMEPPGPPLVRTRERNPQTGERRQLVATVRLDIGNLQVANCIRLALNQIGVDFDLPNDGPIAGAKVQWQLVEGREIVQFFGGNPANQPADAQGVSRIGIEGLGQRREIPATASPVKKQATVRVNVVPETAGVWQELLSVAGFLGGPPLFGAGFGGNLPVLLTLPAELLQRTRWLFIQHHTFEVVDWLTSDRVEIRASATGSSGQTWSFTGTVPLTVDDRGRVTGKATGESALTFHGDCVGTFTHTGVSIEVAGEYHAAADAVHFQKVEFSLGPRTGAFTCERGGGCTLSEETVTCTGPRGGALMGPYETPTSVNLLDADAPVVVLLADGASSSIPNPSPATFLSWSGSLTLRFGE